MKHRRRDLDADRFLQRMMRMAEAEHQQVWLGTAPPHHRLVHAELSRYFDANGLDLLASVESGWDQSTRCDDRWLAHVPVDLNAILYARELDFARAAELLRQPRRAATWRARAAERARAMHELLWDDEQGFFFDYDWQAGRRNPLPTLAGFYPLWAGLATPAQVAHLVREWLPLFECPGGLMTSFDAREGRQWAYSNGWAPLQWLVTAGLDRYGYTAEARRLRNKWCYTCAIVFAHSGALWEKYNVVEPDQPPQGGPNGPIAGFGWSNGVFLDFLRQLEDDSAPG